MDMWWELGILANTIWQGKVDGKRSHVREWTGLSSNEIWREPEDRVVGRKSKSRVAKMD